MTTNTQANTIDPVHDSQRPAGRNMEKELANIVITELDHFQKNFEPKNLNENYLKNEPFVAAALIKNTAGEEQLILVCRHYIPSSHEPLTQGATYANSHADIARCAEKNPGKYNSYKITHNYQEYNYNDQLQAKAIFTPVMVNIEWDGVDARMSWLKGESNKPSLRGLLTDLLENTFERPRAIKLKVELPALAILDPAQGEVYRRPLNARIRISGAPGTGKTTVMIKRLSQKTKHDFLTDEEKSLFVKDGWKEQDWMLFTPSDLLKVYLEKALNKEMLPAGDEHVKVYGDFRNEILRELGVIKVKKGHFELLEGVQIIRLQHASDYKSLSESFSKFIANIHAKHFESAFQKFKAESEKQVSNARREIAALPKPNDPLEQLLSKIERISANQVHFSGDGPVQIYSMHKRLRRDLDDLRNSVPLDSLSNEIKSCIQIVLNNLKLLLESLSIDKLLDLIPAAYADFRRAHSKFYLEESKHHFEARSLKISTAELDLLLLHIMNLLRSLWHELPHDQSGAPKKLSSLLDRMRTNICIDEVTDFSPLEIACMEGFAHPLRGGVTICGDLMQRVTRHGIDSWDALNYFSEDFEACELEIGYRQTARLFEIAKYLQSDVIGGADTGFKSAYDYRDSDAPALIWKCEGGNNDTAEWLAERAFEIFEICGERLPSIAILVPTASDIQPLVETLAPILRRKGIAVDGSVEGKALGNASRVRIFSVEHIKGLEFEAVFYVGIDRMAEIHKELIKKYLYVGLSRAKSFLGISYNKFFPNYLECVRLLLKEQRSFGD